MFEFFIALFGGLFYGNKYSNEKAKLKAYDDRQSAWMSTLESIQSRYVASAELERWAKDFILKGDHFEDICNWFAEDFRYVFGANWKDKLRIPPKAPVLDPKVYKNDAYSFSVPANHITWVYHLLLAKKGKIDHNIPFRARQGTADSHRQSPLGDGVPRRCEPRFFISNGIWRPDDYRLRQGDPGQYF